MCGTTNIKKNTSHSHKQEKCLLAFVTKRYTHPFIQFTDPIRATSLSYTNPYFLIRLYSPLQLHSLFWHPGSTVPEINTCPQTLINFSSDCALLNNRNGFNKSDRKQQTQQYLQYTYNITWGAFLQPLLLRKSNCYILLNACFYT
jgi:hypothetical protein